MTVLAERAPVQAATDSAGTGKTHFRTDIEGLRALIITMVVTHHVEFPVFGGVDMSMALSGYLGVDITIREIKKRLAEKGQVGIDFWRFYARRARRLLPLATLVTFCTVIATYLWLPAYKQGPVAWDALTASVSGINFRLALNATNYFTDNASTSPLQHYWSLGVEEQYWALLPIGLVVAMWIINKLRLGLWALAVMLGGLVAVSLTLSVFITASSQPWAYFGPETRAWELALGGLTAVGIHFFTRMWRSLAAVMGWAGIAAIVYGSIAESHTPAIPGWVMIWSVAGVCMVIASGCAKPKYGPGILLSLPPLRFLGRMSYGWYLWHWPALIIAPYVIGHQVPNVATPQLYLWQKVAVVLGALVLAIGTYYGIERPVKDRKSLTLFPKNGVRLGIRCALASGLAALALLTSATVAASAGTRTVEYADPVKLSQLVNSAPQINNLPALAADSMSSVKNGLYTECLASEAATIANPCYKGDFTGGKTIVLLGSSLAWQWVGPLDTYARDQHARLAIFTKGLCPPDRYDIATHNAECNSWRDDAYRKITALHPSLVIMSSHVADNATADEIRSSVAYFHELGVQVVVIGETPRFGWDVPDCLTTASQHGRSIQSCGASLASIFPNNGKLITMQEAAVKQGGGLYVSPLPWMCTSTFCPPVVGTHVVNRDIDHITVDYALWLTKVIEAALPKLN